MDTSSVGTQQDEAVERGAARRRCRCGHTEAEHTGTVGPNSNNKMWFQTCTHGKSRVDLGYRTELIGVGCNCLGFRKRGWWRR